MTQLLDPVAAYALWAETYQPHAHNAVMLTEERAVLSLLPQDLHGMRVADIGCGTGRYLRLALDRGAAQVVGLDSSHAMLTHASSSRHDLVQSDATEVPMRNNSIDLIVCALMLGHVASLGAALCEFGRVLRPNGRIVCSDFHPIGESFGWQRTFKHNGQRFAVRHFTHTLPDWHAASTRAALTVEAHIDAFVDPDDIPPGANYDPRALEFPVAHAFALSKSPEAPI